MTSAFLIWVAAHTVGAYAQVTGNDPAVWFSLLARAAALTAMFVLLRRSDVR